MLQCAMFHRDGGNVSPPRSITRIQCRRSTASSRLCSSVRAELVVFCHDKSCRRSDPGPRVTNYHQPPGPRLDQQQSYASVLISHRVEKAGQVKHTLLSHHGYSREKLKNDVLNFRRLSGRFPRFSVTRRWTRPSTAPRSHHSVTTGSRSHCRHCFVGAVQV